MTDNDKALIARAKGMDDTDWDRIFALKSQADTDEARQTIHRIAAQAYRDAERMPEEHYGYDRHEL